MEIVFKIFFVIGILILILVVCVGVVGALFAWLYWLDQRAERIKIGLELEKKDLEVVDKWGNKISMTSQGGEEIDFIDCRSRV
jgi:hypothetical protein